MDKIRRLLGSSTIRLGLLASFLIWIASSVVAIVIHYFTQQALIDETARQLDQQQSEILQNIDELGAEGEPSRWLYRRLSNQAAQSSFCFNLRDSDGELLINNSRSIKKATFNDNQLFSIEQIGKNKDIPTVHCLAKEIQLKDGGLFVFGIPFENTLNILSHLDRLRFWGLFSSALLALVIGATISMRGLKGLQKIIQACNFVAQGDLSHRIPISNNHDDFDRLGETINAMLDQIGQLMQGVTRVSDAIAHDLRTPLARMRNQIELMQQHHGNSEDLDLLTQQLDHILNAFNALLRIAQLEQGSLRKAFIRFDFRDVLTTALSIYELVFEEKSIQLTIHQSDTPLPCYGDRDLWVQTLCNLLDNAYKYTPEHGCVGVQLRKDRNQIYMIVNDSGPGIPDEEQNNVFTRFYRLEGHRSQSGLGLGLSLVRAVCHVHNATITLKNLQKNGLKNGLSVVITMPLDTQIDGAKTTSPIKQST